MIHSTAMTAMGYEKAPRWKGPRTKLLRLITRNAIGIAAVERRCEDLKAVARHGKRRTI